MSTNNSPWIHQLKRTRPVDTLKSNATADIAIVGGGIAGISTAFFILKYTKHKVALIEGGKVAHGATGHNAGQIVSYFERQISELSEEFGIDMVADAQRHVDSAWELLAEIYNDTKLQTPFSQFTGYAGCRDYEEVMVHLKNNDLSDKAGLNAEQLFIAEESGIAPKIPKKYDGLYSVLPQKDISSLLETEDHRYIAALSARKGVMNSALFCEELVGYLIATYPDRFSLYEESPMSEVVLEKAKGVLKIKEFEVTAKHIILCTNGFEKFKLTNTVGPDIDAEFHHNVKGSVGYMAAYLDQLDKPPIAISYLPPRAADPHDAVNSEPYIYLTRRPFEIEKEEKHNLICIGGPEALMDDTNNYSLEHPYPEEAQTTIDNFLHETYKYAPKGNIEYKYKWHGLMGYTPSGVRIIGYEPINPVLLYNLGCNGVGILPSIYGGKRISQILAGEKLEPSIFDPQLKA